MQQQSSPLSSREEYKYFIPFDKRSHLMQDLRLFMDLDPYVPANRGFYLVSSVYFENDQLQIYLTKVNGLAKRYKLRVRSYPESVSNTSLIEVKYKLYDKYLKERTTISQEDRAKFFMQHSIGVTDFSHPDNILIHALRYRHLFQLVPFIQVDYRRSAFLGKIDKNIRITFDSNIHCCRYSSHVPIKPNIPVLPGSSILEVKTRGYFPFWLSKIIRKYGLRRSTISKYALSVQRIAINSSMCVR